MIKRYSSAELEELFSDRNRLKVWLEVELLCVQAWAELGKISKEDAQLCRKNAPTIDAKFIEDVSAREKITDHDVAAFVDVTQERIGFPHGSWIHYGLTSSDVVDTALSYVLVCVCDLMLEAQNGLVKALKNRALAEENVPMMGRTHGMHAEPTTLGAKLALWCLQADRDRSRLRKAREAIRVGKLSGAVGTYSNIDPRVEEIVCKDLGLKPVPATQVIARDRHGEFLYALASIGSSIEAFATEIRHLQRSEVAEVSEPFKPGQKGSSAMPHKRNPILSERLCGLARLLRGYLGAGLEDVALWHERDISHSSVERVILPDASMVAYYAIKKMTGLIDGLVVHKDKMYSNLKSSHGIAFSQSILLELISNGMDRDSAYRIVQRDTRVAVEGDQDLEDVVKQDPEVRISEDRLTEIFSLERALANTRRTITALSDVE